MLSSIRRAASRDASPDARDVALATRLHSGDAAALDELLQRDWRQLVSYAAHLLNNDDLAEDVAQRAFIRLWERRDRVEPSKGVKTLLYRIARNIALNEQRAVRVRERCAHEISGPAMLSPTDSVRCHELERAVRDAIARLTPRRREAFLLARFDELSYREIGEVMGLSVQTVANHISAALSELRCALAPLLSDGTKVWTSAQPPSISSHVPRAAVARASDASSPAGAFRPA
jgi:RNA polymerase sigma-70 factor, ECF subfamily